MFLYDEKLKNFCPYAIGDIYVTTLSINPASRFLNTTWEELSADKYIKSGGTALQTGGNNNISIQKANLPNIKLKMDSISVSIPAHNHRYARYVGYSSGDAGNAPVTQDGNGPQAHFKYYYTDDGGGGDTGSTSPYTEVLGDEAPISIQPAYITLKFWKRLT